MPYRLTLFLLLVFTLLPSGARALDWSTSLVPPQGPLPVLLGQAQELSDGSVLLAGEGEAGYLSGESARVRLISRVGIDGSVLWTRSLGAATATESTQATAVAELGGGKLIVAFSRRVFAIESNTGTVLWHRQLEARVHSLEAAPSGNFYAVGDVVDFPFFQTSYAALLSGNDGLALWTQPPASSSPIFTYVKAAKFSNGDLLAIGSRGILVRLSSVDGSVIWQTSGLSNAPVQSGTAVEIDELDRIAHFHGDSGGGLELRAGSDGSLIWSLSEAQSLQSHTPFAVWIAQGNVFTVSHFIPGASVQVHLRSFRMDNGSENWRSLASDVGTGPRFPRSARLSPDSQRIAVLLASSQFRDLQFGGTAGRRLLLVNTGAGNLISSAELPVGSEAQLTSDLTWTAAQGLSLAGVREVASGQPALLLTRFDTAAATVGASAIVQASGYAEFTSGGLTLLDGSSVVLSRRGGLAQPVFALTRLDAEGEQLWRTEHLPQTGVDWYVVDAKQADETSLVVVLARSQAQAGQIVRVDIETGEILYLQPVTSEISGSFRPAVLEVDVSRSRLLIGGTIPGGAVVSWHRTNTGERLWYGVIASNEFSTSWATIKRIQVLSDGGVLVLARVFQSEAQFVDMLHSLESVGLHRWMRSLGTGMAELDLLQVEEAAMEARVWGRSGPPPFFVRELTISLTDGATLATQSLECSGSGSTSSGWVFRLGAQLVHLLECPAAGTPGYRLWTRASWSATPTSAEVSGLPAATTIRQAATGSEGRLNVTLGTTVAGARASIARLSISGARVLGITPLQTSDGQPFSNPSLIGTGSTAIVAGGHQAFDRPRIVVGASRDSVLFGDGFEN
jgi:outer membrane protein assembly factor BamB